MSELTPERLAYMRNATNKAKESGDFAHSICQVMGQDLADLLGEIDAFRSKEERIRDLHKPDRRMKSVPVFDEYDEPLAVINGCTCGSNRYPCPTLEILDGD